MNALLQEYNLPEGRYNQIRMDISRVVVTSWLGNKVARLPSNQLKINIDLEVRELTTSSVLFDFVADQSLHIIGTGNSGMYLLAPVVKLTIKEEATIEEVNEPYLLQLGLIERTTRGRALTAHAYEHLGKTPPKNSA